MMRLYIRRLALLWVLMFTVFYSNIVVAQDSADTATQNNADTATQEENGDIIAKANQLLAEQLRSIFKDMKALEANINLLQQDIDGLGQILHRDLSEAELKTLRKKQSKDVAEIILRFQERINFFEQQATELTGLSEELNFRYQPLQEKLAALEDVQAETIINHDKLSDSHGELILSYEILHDLYDELSDSHDILRDSYDEFHTSSLASQTLIDTQQQDLLKLITQQNELLKKQQKTINKQASSIKTLEKNHNALVKEFQKLVNQLSKTE
ncbi:MAG: hypothetical protein K0U39_05790 [Alphaproteobacteria bacterium]|nr:hypothetical protein [Alphaproteobacteria bacterium]